MTEAYPLDLNYGHFGEPSYDSENHEWHFPRQPGRTRELKPIGLPVTALQSPLHSHTAHIQSATERTRNVKNLTQQHPELLPASSLLPGLAQLSEVVDAVTSSYDPTVSELLAFGGAVDSDRRGHGLITVPIAVIVGGVAGESVRLLLLNNEKLGWEDSKNIRLCAFSSKGGEEGSWSGNGSPIQQVVFAEEEGRSSSWLAVRYHGAISVLRPQLRRNADSGSLAHAVSSRNPPSRVNANHIVTLSVKEANNVPYSDVAFNPWYNQQVATIDHDGFWAIWDIEKREKEAKGRRSWTVKKTRSGGLREGLPEDETLKASVPDGWGVVLWAGNLSTIVVANRRMFAVFDISGDPRRLSVPDFVSSVTSELILDVKRGSKDSTHVFVATTSSIYWLQVIGSTANHQDEDVAAGVRCLLSWRHFRDPEDISLSLRVADDSEKGNNDEDGESTIVLLYSRLTGITNVFTFQYEKSSSSLAPSASDPYLLPLPIDRQRVLVPSIKSYVLDRGCGISAIYLKAMKYDSPQGAVMSGLGKTFFDNKVTFYQLILLANDLALSECLYAEVPKEFNTEVSPPDKISRLDIPKTPAKINTDFIVPNGYVEMNDESSPNDSIDEEISEAESQTSLAVLHKDPWTISFERLEEEFHRILADAHFSTGFHEILDLRQDEIERKLTAGVPTMETLLDTVTANISVLDLDKAAGDFVDYVDDIKRLTYENQDGDEMEEGRQMMVSTILTPKLRAGLGFHDTAELSAIYRDLIQTWIVPMSRQIPGRVRIALEKTLRNMAGQMSLASYAMSIDLVRNITEEEGQSNDWEAGAEFELPVRRRTSVTSLGKRKERLDEVSTLQSSSQMSEDTGSKPSSAIVTLPTPEPTPSLRSRSSASSLAGSEGPEFQLLQAYASVVPLPTLPTKISTILGHWQCGDDPDTYDYETAQQDTVTESEHGDNSRKRRKVEKQRKRQREITVGPSTLPARERLGASQPQLGQETQETQGSSQQTEKAVTMSQVEHGKYGGRHVKNKKLKGKAKPAGFK